VERLVRGAWQAVGGPVAGGVQAPKLGVVAGRLYVVWSQAGVVHLSSFNGSQWVAAGPIGRDTSLSSGVPVIADVRGAPYVAFTEGPLSVTGSPLPGTGAVVFRFAKGIWVQVGTRQLLAAHDAAQSVSLAAAGNVAYLAWREGDEVGVARWDSRHKRWAPSLSLMGADQPVLRELGGTLYLVYADLTTGTARTLALSGRSWHAVGTPLGPADSGYDGIASPALTALGGRLYIAAIEFSATGPLRSKIELAELGAGGVWERSDTPASPAGVVEKLSFTASAGQLVLAWGQQQCGGPLADLNVLVATYDPGAPSNVVAGAC
jgi:hypothetical protein